MELKLEAKDAVQQRLLDYLTANASDALAEKINAGKKTLAGAVKHATAEARKMADQGSGCVCVDDATVFGWVIHYFEEDSIAEPKATTPVRSAAQVVKAQDAAKKRRQRPKTAPKVNPAAGPVQLDLFAALLGGAPA